MNYFAAFAGRARPRELVRAAVDVEDAGLRALLAGTAPERLSAEAVEREVAGHLGQLTGEAFQYFLPGLMTLVEGEYEELRDFAGELVGALTEPARQDVEASLEVASQIPKEFGLSEELLSQLREQQLEWFDSGDPGREFARRVEGLSAGERAAVLEFLVRLEREHGEDFPFAEVGKAIRRYWEVAGRRVS